MLGLVALLAARRARLNASRTLSAAGGVGFARVVAWAGAYAGITGALALAVYGVPRAGRSSGSRADSSSTLRSAVFEIGNSLREARERRGLDFAQAELATKIRGKYLRALEDEQFAVLPAQTYVKGFLRTYAEYLGLDGQLYVDEFNSRFVSGEEYEPRVRRSAARRPQRRHRRLETNVVFVALGVIAILTVIVISAWKAASGIVAGGAAGARRRRRSSHRPKVKPPLFEVTARSGQTHVIVHKGSATGNVVFDGTISKGDPARAIKGTRLWVQIDTPENLRIKIDGHVVRVPGAQPRVGIVTKTGWHAA